MEWLHDEIEAGSKALSFIFSIYPPKLYIYILYYIYICIPGPSKQIFERLGFLNSWSNWNGSEYNLNSLQLLLQQDEEWW